MVNTHYRNALYFIHLLCYSIYDGSLGLKESDAEDVLKWISLIAMEDNIEHVSEQMLERLLQDHKVIIEMNLYSREKALKPALKRSK